MVPAALEGLLDFVPARPKVVYASTLGDFTILKGFRLVDNNRGIARF